MEEIAQIISEGITIISLILGVASVGWFLWKENKHEQIKCELEASYYEMHKRKRARSKELTAPAPPRVRIEDVGIIAFLNLK